MTCARASIEIGGEHLAGRPEPAFLAVSEVWTTAPA